MGLTLASVEVKRGGKRERWRIQTAPPLCPQTEKKKKTSVPVNTLNVQEKLVSLLIKLKRTRKFFSFAQKSSSSLSRTAARRLGGACGRRQEPRGSHFSSNLQYSTFLHPAPGRFHSDSDEKKNKTKAAETRCESYCGRDCVYFFCVSSFV